MNPDTVKAVLAVVISALEFFAKRSGNENFQQFVDFIKAILASYTVKLEGISATFESTTAAAEGVEPLPEDLQTAADDFANQLAAVE